MYVMANLSILTRLSADVLTEQRVFFGYQTDWGFEMLITLATILYGFLIAGICKSIVVDPSASPLWWIHLQCCGLVALQTPLSIMLFTLPRPSLDPCESSEGLALTLSHICVSITFACQDTLSSSSLFRSHSAGIGFPTSYSPLLGVSPSFAGLPQRTL